MKKRSVIIVAVAAAVIGISAVAYAGSVTAFSENVNLLSTQSGLPVPRSMSYVDRLNWRWH